MQSMSRFVLALAIAVPGGAGFAQQKKNEEDFLKEKPAIGDELPDVTVYSTDGKEVKTSSLRGQHVVLTFGCLT